jgi:hypothetical protein
MNILPQFMKRTKKKLYKIIPIICLKIIKISSITKISNMGKNKRKLIRTIICMDVKTLRRLKKDGEK